MPKNSFVVWGVGAGAALLALIIFLTSAKSGLNKPALAFPPQFRVQELYLEPIQAASVAASLAGEVTTGLIVPHHLLARDVIARAFLRISSTRPSVVLLMSPDHFNLGETPITVAARDFNTVFGQIKTDQELVNKLLRVPGVKAGEFFYREHGIGAELPFIKYFLPDAKIIALTIKEDATLRDLDPLISEFKKILTASSTLIIESTDFSHYLPEKIARVKDEETEKAMKAGEPDAILKLTQPDHLDSRAVLYVNMRLQQELFKAKLNIFEHKNSQAYTKDYVKETTSYFTAVYSK